MELTVRRLVVRSSIAAAIALGSAVVVAPQAAAEAPCPEGTARVFFANSTNTCQGSGSMSYTSPAISKVCSTSGTDVVVDATIRISKRKTQTQHSELSNGRCGRFEIAGQTGSTVTVS